MSFCQFHFEFVAIQLVRVAEKVDVEAFFEFFEHVDAGMGHINKDGIPSVVDLLVGEWRRRDGADVGTKFRHSDFSFIKKVNGIALSCLCVMFGEVREAEGCKGVGDVFVTDVVDDTTQVENDVFQHVMRFVCC